MELRSDDLLKQIKKKKLFEYYRANPDYLSIEDVQWLVKQAELLKRIADTWVAIETNGTSEDADNFYSIIQDILTEQHEN